MLTEKNVNHPLLSYANVDTLDCREVWRRHSGENLFHADAITNIPVFYPIYRFNSYYSFSPLPLLLHKGYLVVDPKIARRLQRDRSGVSSPAWFVDREIERLIGDLHFSKKIVDVKIFVQSMAQAMQDDWTAAEQQNPGFTNVVLCGGKDSQNLLLLKSRHPIIAYSARPNYPIVQEFVRENKLDVEVRELYDKDNSHIRDREIAEAFCMVNLEDWRWTPHLVEIAESFQKRVVFWKGQLGDLFLTDNWRMHTFLASRYLRRMEGFWRYLPRPMLSLVDPLLFLDFQRLLIRRSAVVQGAHMGFLRSIVDCLFLSGYHGECVTRTWLAADLPRLNRDHPDLRPLIGREILGRDVVYSQENPGPPRSGQRRGLRNLDAFKKAVHAFGITERR